MVLRRNAWFCAIPDIIGAEIQTLCFNGADGGGRTHTSSRIPDFESGASANSATSATNKINGLTPYQRITPWESQNLGKIGSAQFADYGVDGSD
jgi:hypothetical protein